MKEAEEYQEEKSGKIIVNDEVMNNEGGGERAKGEWRKGVRIGEANSWEWWYKVEGGKRKEKDGKETKKKKKVENDDAK